MPIKHLGVYDPETGEEEGRLMVWLPKKIPIGRDFVMTFQDGLAAMAENKALTGAPLRVFLFLASNLDYGNTVYVPQIQIAERLDMTTQGVNRALRVLIQQGIIAKGPKHGNSPSFVIRDEYAWRGKGSDYHVHRQSQFIPPPISMTYPPAVPA